jgi:hypothetical protein
MDTLFSRLYSSCKEWHQDKNDIVYVKKYLNDKIKVEDAKNKISPIALLLLNRIEEFRRSEINKISFEIKDYAITASAIFPSKMPIETGCKIRFILEDVGENKNIKIIIPDNKIDRNGDIETFMDMKFPPFLEIEKIKRQN